MSAESDGPVAYGTAANLTTHTSTATTEDPLVSDPSRRYLDPPGGVLDAIPGGVSDGHPGLTPRVVAAIAWARLHHHDGHAVTDDDGPHEHHWQAILYWCRGCGACEDEHGRPV